MSRASRETAKRYIKRGRLDVTIKWDKGDEYASVPKANEEAIRWYVDLARHLKASYGLKGDLTVTDMLTFKDILVYEEKSVPEEMFFSCFETLLAKLNEEREREGELIEQDLIGRLEQIREDVEKIEKALARGDQEPRGDAPPEDPGDKRHRDR